MSKAYIVNHHKFQPHGKALAKMRKALADLDVELRNLGRNTDLYEGERQRRAQEARQAADRRLAEARAEMLAAAERDRAETTYVDSPTGEELQRRQYWATAAASEMSGLDGRMAVSMIRTMVEAGEHERAREYIRAARPAAQAVGMAGDLSALEQRAAAPEAKMHRAFAASLDAVDYQLGWLDKHVGDLKRQAGAVPYEVKQGLAEERPLDDRRLSLWFDDMQQAASVAFERTAAELDGKEPASWARPGARPAPGDGGEAA